MAEIIPKPAEEIPIWQKILGYFSIFVLVSTIAISVLLILNEKKAKTTLWDLKEKIAQAKSPEILALEKEVLTYQKKINHFSSLIEQHLFISKFFPFLEERTHQKVFFSKIDLSLDEAKVDLSGQTDSFLILEQQLSLLQREPLIKDLNLSRISITKERKIEFELEFSFDPQILKPY